MSSVIQVTIPPQPGTALQQNRDVRKIYTSLEAMADGGWEVVTVIETGLVLDARDSRHRAEACEQLVQDVETDARGGLLVGRVILRGQ